MNDHTDHVASTCSNSGHRTNLHRRADRRVRANMRNDGYERNVSEVHQVPGAESKPLKACRDVLVLKATQKRGAECGPCGRCEYSDPGH